ncbi:MAG: sugar ABC transporter substrate-binding protein [Trueperaceae bacterium]|nr:sugar ABC transporter substrate-binding protein [Trueperaceae bacterium]
MKRTLFVLCTLMFGFAQAQTLTVWVWDINKPALESTIASFQEMHPGVEVVVEDLGNQNVYDRGLAGCAAGGFDLPDVYLVENNEAPVFWAQFPDCFVDLRDFGAEELVSDFPDFKWSELRTQDGTIYAIPYDSGPTAIFYRRDLYEQAGIDPDAIATWDDFIAAGVQLNAAFDGEVKMGTISKGGDDEWFRMIANQAGCFYFDPAGTEITVNQPGCVQALEQIGDLWNADILLPGGWVEQIQYFQNGLEASAFFGAWYTGTIISNAPEQAGLWGVYPTPALEEGGVRAANLGGSALAITTASDNPELAYDFVVNALADTDNQVDILFNYGLVPSYLPVQDAAALEQGVDYFGGQPVWDLLLGTLGDVPPANGTQFFQEARNVMTAVVNDYLNGNYDSAQAALDRAANQIAQATGLPIAD